MSEKKKPEHAVLAMDTLISDPSIINPEPDEPKITDTMIVPGQYLDSFYLNFNEESTKGDSIRECMRIFDKLMKDNNSNSRFLLKNGSILEIRDLEEKDFNNLDPTSAGHQAIAMARTSKDPYPIVTGSSRLMPIIRRSNLEVVEINKDPYIGRRKLNLPYEYSNEWYGNHKISKSLFADMYPQEKPLRANEFVEFVFDEKSEFDYSFRNIGRWDPDEEQLVPLEYFKQLPYKIHPRNAGQAMMAEALMAPSDKIPIVIIPGSFGTGKTFLTTAAGLAQTEGNGHEACYDTIFICPRDGFLGRQHGFLPGELENKLDPLIDPVKDQLKKIIKLRGPEKSKYRAKQESGENTHRNKTIAEKIEWYLNESGLFEIKPVVYMGGRSIDDAFIIYDEFQDMERGQAKALLTRIGEGSKIVAMGDPTQFTNPHLSTTSNGLSYAASIFSRKKYRGAAVITMFSSENERSEAAKEISEIFERM